MAHNDSFFNRPSFQPFNYRENKNQRFHKEIISNKNILSTQYDCVEQDDDPLNQNPELSAFLQAKDSYFQNGQLYTLQANQSINLSDISSNIQLEDDKSNEFKKLKIASNKLHDQTSHDIEQLKQKFQPSPLHGQKMHHHHHQFKKLSKRSLEILDLKTRPDPIEKRLEDSQISERKGIQNKSRAPVYFFQPQSSRMVKQSSECRQDVNQDNNPMLLRRDRSKSEQITQLIKGCQNIIFNGEVLNQQEQPNSQNKYSQMFQTPTRKLQHKFKPTQKPIRQDPHQIKMTMSQEFSQLKIFQTQSSDQNFNEKRQFGRNQKDKQDVHPLTPDNTPNSSQYQAFKSPVLQQQRSQKIIRPFLQKQSKSSDLPFQADSKIGSDNSRQKDENDHSHQSNKEQAKEQQEEEESKSMNYIKNSLIAVHHQKQLLMSEPTEFNILVAGQSGIGKTTFIKQFLHKFSKGNFQIEQTLNQDNFMNRRAATGTKTIQFKQYSVDRSQSELKLKINMIDSPGFGNESNIDDWIKKIKNQLKHRMVQYRDEKVQISKNKQKQMIKFMMKQPNDHRIHCCLYFINGHHTKNCDMISMKQISKYTNVLPVLSKADSFTTDELIEAKCNIIQDANQANVKFFDCIEAIKIIEFEHPGSIIESKLGPCPPFCVIGATDYIKHFNERSSQRYQKTQNVSGGGQVVSGRQYPWGFCDAENVNHSDFLILYQALISKYLKSNCQKDYLCIPCIKTTENYYKKYMKQIRIKQNNQNKSFQNVKSAAKYTLFGMAFGAASFLISKFKK